MVFFLSTFLQNCFPCWDRWNGDMTPTLDAALGQVLIYVMSPDWFEELCPLGFLIPK